MNENIERVVYLICVGQDPLNYRASLILSLKESFERMTLVTQNGTIEDNEHMVTGAFPNPLGIFRLLGLHSLKSRLERYCYFPSREVLYGRYAIKRLIDKISIDNNKGRNVSLVTFLPPHTLSLIGLSLKKRFPEIRWIVDWQDLWSYDNYYFKRVPKLYQKRLLKIEKQILKTCDVNITTNTDAKIVLEKKYNIPKERVIAIPHPFCRHEVPDLEQLVENNRQKTNGKLTIGFLGNLFKLPKVPGYRVVKAIEDANESGANIKLHIFGDGSDSAKKTAEQSTEGMVVLHPRVSHEESLRRISDCDFLLLALADIPNCYSIMHSKLPHYLLLKRPILAMVPDGSAVAKVIKETGTGFVIDTGKNWGNTLSQIVNNYRTGENQPIRDEVAIEKYSWPEISKKWLSIL